MASVSVIKDIVSTIATGESSGNPIPLSEALRRWGGGSAWEELVDFSFIRRETAAVTLTEKGKAWHAKNCPAKVAA